MNFMDFLIKNQKTKKLLFSDKKIINIANFCLDLDKWSKEKMFLGWAHLLYQKYLEVDSAYYISTTDEQSYHIKKMLWLDQDASDTNNVVTPILFYDIKKDFYNRLRNHVDQQWGDEMIRNFVKKSFKRRSKRILNAFKRKSFIISKKVEDWKELQISNWLTEIGLQYLSELFINNSILGTDLLEITEADLEEIGVLSLDITLIMDKIKDLK